MDMDKLASKLKMTGNNVIGNNDFAVVYSRYDEVTIVKLGNNNKLKYITSKISGSDALVSMSKYFVSIASKLRHGKPRELYAISSDYNILEGRNIKGYIFVEIFNKMNILKGLHTDYKLIVTLNESSSMQVVNHKGEVLDISEYRWLFDIGVYFGLSYNRVTDSYEFKCESTKSFMERKEGEHGVILDYKLFETDETFRNFKGTDMRKISEDFLILMVMQQDM